MAISIPASPTTSVPFCPPPPSILGISGLSCGASYLRKPSSKCAQFHNTLEWGVLHPRHDSALRADRRTTLLADTASGLIARSRTATGSATSPPVSRPPRATHGAQWVSEGRRRARLAPPLDASHVEACMARFHVRTCATLTRRRLRLRVPRMDLRVCACASA